jgi:hypothetical protein
MYSDGEYAYKKKMEMTVENLNYTAHKIESFYDQYKRYPRDLGELEDIKIGNIVDFTNLVSFSNAKSPFKLSKNSFLQYEYKGHYYYLYAVGRDQKHKTPDDITPLKEASFRGLHYYY